jgi:hypothetical protein
MAKDGAALLIGLGRPKGKPMGESEPDEDMDSGSAEDDAMADFFDKGSAGDWAGAKDALKTFIELCYPSIGGGESDYEEGETSEEV